VAHVLAFHFQRLDDVVQSDGLFLHFLVLSSKRIITLIIVLYSTDVQFLFSSGVANKCEVVEL
jgi:hypothetical protein